MSFHRDAWDEFEPESDIVNDYLDKRFIKRRREESLEERGRNKEAEEIMDILVHLYRHDFWDERLLEPTLFGDLENLLAPREFFIMEELIKGTANEEIIAILKKNSPQGTFDEVEGLIKYKSNIRKKIKDNYQTQLPGWIREQVWNKGDEDGNEGSLEETNE